MEGCLVRAVRLLALFIVFALLLLTADCVGGFMLERYWPSWRELVEDAGELAGRVGAVGRDGSSGGEASIALDRFTRRVIQQGLRNEGFNPGAMDGLFGPRTRAAIRDWQQSRGAPRTGYLNRAQVELLRAAGALPPALPEGFSPVSRRGGVVQGSTSDGFFTRGSHEDEVLRLQGTPTGISILSGSEIWRYGLSTVTISTTSRRVIEWSDHGGVLRVRLAPSEALPPLSELGGVVQGSASDGPPRMVRNVSPRYTAEAMRAKVEGVVVVEAVVLPDGSVGDVTVIRPLDAGLDEEAIRAARRMRFERVTRA